MILRPVHRFDLKVDHDSVKKFAVSMHFTRGLHFTPDLGSVGLCRHNFEYIWSIRHNAGIIQHNAFVSENCEKCMKLSPATPSKLDKSVNRLVSSEFSMLLVFGSSNAGSLEKDKPSYI